MTKYEITKCAMQSDDLLNLVRHLPEEFSKLGTIIHDGRNCIRRVRIKGLEDLGIQEVVIKRYHKPNIFQRLDYTFIRHSKAHRSYDYANIMLQRGIGTPTPLAYVEEWRHHIFLCCYYICAATEGFQLKEQIEEDDRLCVAFARFVAKMHEQGILHGDLNSTNTLCVADETAPNGFRFSVVDINRARIFPEAIPLEKCLKDFYTFSAEPATYQHFVQEYLKCRNAESEEMANYIIRKKHRHDHRPRPLKRLTRPFKKMYYKALE